jgi:hypothetical protein
MKHYLITSKANEEALIEAIYANKKVVPRLSKKESAADITFVMVINLSRYVSYKWKCSRKSLSKI